MTKIVHKNPWFSIEKSDLKNNGVYFVLKKKTTIFIVAETDDRKIIFIKEYRYPIKKTIWQLPAGMIDKKGELNSAQRELFEETGLKAKKWKKIGYFFVAPGHEDTKIVVFSAKNLEMSQNSYITSEADISKIKEFSKEEIQEMIKKNSIVCSITLAALSLYFAKN